MSKISLKELEKLLLIGRTAEQYAWDHYDELAARDAVYRLYGPADYGIGAGIPGGFTPKKSRKLSTQTRRKNYIVYELDSNFKLLRTKYVENYEKIGITYHCFELNGVQYAYPFRGTQKQRYRGEVIAIYFVNGFPIFWGFLRNESLLIHFSEPLPNEKMHTTVYSYTPLAKYTVHGYPVDFNAPIGALNSPVEKNCYEEDFIVTDFSQWFK